MCRCSRPFSYTVLPHHTATLVEPIVPVFGYWSVKKMKIVEMAVPESSAADNT
jgi:hypothetical protein